MRTLKNRSEIARAINFKEYPTVVIDVSKTDEYGITGARVCIDNGKYRDGSPYFIDAVIRAFNDTHKLEFQAFGCAISNSFGYYDMIRMLNYANVPIIKANQEILVCMYDSSKRLEFFPVILKTGSTVRPHCQAPLDLEEYDVGMYMS